MELNKAEDKAREYFRWFHIEDWKFKFDNSVSRFGLCSHSSKTISLSRHLTLLNAESEVYDVILHELAHAVVGPRNGHNRIWKDACKALGARPERCYSATAVIAPPKKYSGECPRCFRTYPRFRRKRIACGRCCNEHNNGKFDPDYLLVWSHV